MAKKKYFSMNEVPVGTKMVVKETGEEVILEAVYNFPTTFKTIDNKGLQKAYFTYQVDILDWPAQE
jgi:hypothetical protein